MTRLQFWWDANEFCCCKGTNNHWKSKYFSKKNRVKVDFFYIFIFNNVKLRLKKTFYHPNKVVFKVKMLPLYRLYPYRKPRWAEVGQTYIHIRRNCTLWFWQCKNLAVRAKVVKNKATGTPHEVYCIQPSLASDDSVVCCQECFLYTYTGVGLSALY